MKKILAFIVALLLPVWICYAAVDTLEGEELTDAANIEGVTTTDTVEGQVLKAGGAGIEFDAVTDSSGVDGTSITSLTWSHTVASGATLIVVGVGAYYYEDPTITSVTFNGDALTLITDFGSHGGLDEAHAWGYYRTNPDITAGNVVVTFGATIDYGMAGAISFKGTNTGGQFDTVVTEQDCSINVSSASGDWVFDVIASDDNSLTVGSGQTERVNFVVATDYSFAMSTEGGAASVTMDWTSCTGETAIGGISINPAP